MVCDSACMGGGKKIAGLGRLTQELRSCGAHEKNQWVGLLSEETPGTQKNRWGTKRQGNGSTKGRGLSWRAQKAHRSTKSGGSWNRIHLTLQGDRRWLVEQMDKKEKVEEIGKITCQRRV